MRLLATEPVQTYVRNIRRTLRNWKRNSLVETRKKSENNNNIVTPQQIRFQNVHKKMAMWTREWDRENQKIESHHSNFLFTPSSVNAMMLWTCHELPLLAAGCWLLVVVDGCWCRYSRAHNFYDDETESPSISGLRLSISVHLLSPEFCSHSFHFDIRFRSAVPCRSSTNNTEHALIGSNWFYILYSERDKWAQLWLPLEIHWNFFDKPFQFNGNMYLSNREDPLMST